MRRGPATVPSAALGEIVPVTATRRKATRCGGRRLEVADKAAEAAGSGLTRIAGGRAPLGRLDAEISYCFPMPATTC